MVALVLLLIVMVIVIKITFNSAMIANVVTMKKIIKYCFVRLNCSHPSRSAMLVPFSNTFLHLFGSNVLIICYD